MAINLDDRYPGRAGPKNLAYPQGSFKNRTSPTSKDGTYLEKDWANDWAGFFQALLSNAGMTANGVVDTAQASQYFDALMAAVGNRFAPTATFAEIAALTEDDGPIICNDQGGAVYVWNGAAYAPLLGGETYAGALKIATTALAQGLTNDTTALTPKKLGDALDATALGWDQTWQDVTASRAASTTYTNTAGRPIIVRVTCNNTTTSFNASLFVDGVSVDDVTFSYGSGSITSRSTLIAIVPPGETYSFEYTGGSWTRWMELR